ncbi:MAG: divergent polysaccharide deacetylase family protein [Deltaproteobacteria bacterium]|nr:divergent polysaccharide deacetylase family protein [Deltaproteobacteria bacterium]
MRRKAQRSRKASKKKSFRTILFFALGVCVAAGAYFFAKPLFEGDRFPQKSPLFEIYPSKNFEARLQYLDRAIYAGLLELGVSVDDVAFQSVYQKYSKDLHWNFAVLEIRPPKFPSKADIKTILDRYLSKQISGATYQIASDGRYPIVLHVSLDQHPTHRLLFLKELKRVLPPPVLKALPKVAIILDDVGYDKRLALDFLSLDASITVSIFPFSPYKKKISSVAHKKGRDVMLHLPMEPLEYPKVNPGEGVLLTSMDMDALLAQLEVNLDEIPYIVGVNNHMGSKFTADPERMEYVFKLLRDRGLFFVDSRTTTRTCARRVARSIKLKFAERQVFLDHLQEESFIRRQIKQLASIARSRGSAIGIIHPHRLTYRILKAELANLKKDVEIVPVSQLVH